MNKKIIIPSIVILALLVVTGIATYLVQTPTQVSTRAALNRAHPVWQFEGEDTQNWVGAGIKSLKVKNGALQGNIIASPAYLYSPPRLSIGKEKSRSNQVIINLSFKKTSESPEKINFTLTLTYLTNQNNDWKNTTPLTQEVKNLFAPQNYSFMLPILPQDEHVTSLRLGLKNLKGHTFLINSIKVE